MIIIIIIANTVLCEELRHKASMSPANKWHSKEPNPINLGPVSRFNYHTIKEAPFHSFIPYTIPNLCWVWKTQDV